VKPGDLFYVSAGTVHALGKGLVVYEIQQASDVTYRLFDYGRDRPLNVQEAIDNINVPFVKSDCHSHDNILIDSKYFTLAYIKNHG
jgi:mannose-6-phosphate isomerase